MAIESIRSERDYRRVLKEIEALMDARPGTSDGERLDALATLVAAWEARHHGFETEPGSTPPNH